MNKSLDRRLVSGSSTPLFNPASPETGRGGENRFDFSFVSSTRKQIIVKGIVQGVGFRPFVWRLASELACTGFVRNSTSGVQIEVQGNLAGIESFERRLRLEAPSLSRILELTAATVEAKVGETDFLILDSELSEKPIAAVSPDVGICENCLAEMRDRSDRRFGYPFINCTHCGPRYTIICSLPYDRQRTTMNGFLFCNACRREYESPADRRFHAEPNACLECGPKIWFVDSKAKEFAFRATNDVELDVEKEGIRTRKEIELVQSRISRGEIIAIKGVGGFHLACDAIRSEAVNLLRQRKKRPDKPLAVMVSDLETCKKLVHLNESEAKLLTSRERPIVLLRKKGQSALGESLAPGNPFLGVMLPYSPLHYLLLPPGQVWVMTSGNITDEPIAIENEDAWWRLRDIADGFLMHNRPIHAVCDDSVLRILNGEVTPIRRSRGFAPLDVPLATSTFEPTILAVGGEIKATVCLAVNSHAFLSQHIGDMGNAETLRMIEHVSEHLLKLYHAKPEAIAADMHPSYLSVMWATRKAQSFSIPLVQVQHHHAHAASLMAEHELPPTSQIIACVFDGTGYGTDHTIWGGEWLIASQQAFRRYAHLRTIPLPGGDACILRPARSALAHLFRYEIPWHEALPCVKSLSAAESRLLKTQLAKGLHCVESSSMGRLFDAVSALIGVRQEIHYEGQAAIELESIAAEVLADEVQSVRAYPFRWERKVFWEMHCGDILKNVIADCTAGIPLGLISANFHATLSQATLDICLQARSETGLTTVGLTGGVFQNALLTRMVLEKLERHSFRVLTHQMVPPNDAGLALGQTVIGREQLRISSSKSQ